MGNGQSSFDVNGDANEPVATGFNRRHTTNVASGLMSIGADKSARQAWGEPASTNTASQQQNQSSLPSIPGLAQSYNPDAVNLTINRDPLSGFGITFVGPSKKPDAPKSGVFITQVKAEGPAMESGKVFRGQQILSVNGVDTLLSTKEEMVKLVVNEDILNLELLYDPHGFAFYDKGEELRRISLHAFSVQDEDAPGTWTARYLGVKPVQATTLKGIQDAYKKVRKNRRPDYNTKLTVSLTNMLLVAHVKKPQGVGELVSKHPLIDVTTCQCSGPVVVLVSNDFVQNRRSLFAHVYSCKNHKEALALQNAVQERCSAGFQRVKSTIKRPEVRPRALTSPPSMVAKPQQLFELGASPAKTTTTGASAARSKAVNNTAAPQKIPDIQWTYSSMLNRKMHMHPKVPADHFALMNVQGGLLEQLWYQPGLTQTQVFSALQPAPVGAFFLLDGPQEDSYVMWVRHATKAVPRKILPQLAGDDVEYLLDLENKAFDTMPRLIHNYVNHPFVLLEGDCKLVLPKAAPMLQHSAPAVKAPPTDKRVNLLRTASGLGLKITSEKNVEGTTVTGIKPGGDAERAGLRVGDVITAINGQSTVKMDHKSVVSALMSSPSLDIGVASGARAPKSQVPVQALAAAAAETTHAAGKAKAAPASALPSFQDAVNTTTEALDPAAKKLQAEKQAEIAAAQEEAELQADLAEAAALAKAEQAAAAAAAEAKAASAAAANAEDTAQRLAESAAAEAEDAESEARRVLEESKREAEAAAASAAANLAAEKAAEAEAAAEKLAEEAVAQHAKVEAEAEAAAKAAEQEAQEAEAEAERLLQEAEEEAAAAEREAEELAQQAEEEARLAEEAAAEEIRQAEAEAAEAEEALRKEAEDAKRQAEELANKAEEEKARLEAEATAKAEELKREAELAEQKVREEKEKLEAEAKAKAEEAAREAREAKERLEAEAKAKAEEAAKRAQEEKERLEAEAKAKAEEVARKAEEEKEKLEAEAKAKADEAKKQVASAASSVANGVLPTLGKVDINMTERERQLAEVDEAATEARLSEMTFNFSFG